MDYLPHIIGALSGIFVAILCFHWFFKDRHEFMDCVKTFTPSRFSSSHGHHMEEAGKTLQLFSWAIVWLGAGLMAAWFVEHILMNK